MEHIKKGPRAVRGRSWPWAPVTYPLMGCLFMTAAGMVGSVIGNAYLTWGGLAAAAACGLVSLAAGFIALAADYETRLRRHAPLIGSADR